jgi:hypothetical protein
MRVLEAHAPVQALIAVYGTQLRAFTQPIGATTPLVVAYEAQHPNHD